MASSRSVASYDATPEHASDSAVLDRHRTLGATGNGSSQRRVRRWPRIFVAYVATVFLLLTLNFFLPRLMPGDPISALVDSADPRFVGDASVRAALSEHYGLDRPLLAQYRRYLAGLARGDLGLSIRYNVPVSRLIADRLPWSVLLAVTATSLAMGVGLLAGVHSGWRRGRPADRRLLVLFIGIRNLPVFFLASIAAYVFAVKLGWVPLAGARTPFSDSFGLLRRLADIAHHLLLPASVMALQSAGTQYLIMRGGMVTQLGADYLLLGRAKGLGERRLKYAYAARNAVLPVVAMAAMQLAFAVSGTIFVERVFAYPGLGRLTFDAVGFRDYPTLQGCFLVFTLAVVTLNFLADGLLGRLDPRAKA